MPAFGITDAKVPKHGQKMGLRLTQSSRRATNYLVRQGFSSSIGIQLTGTSLNNATQGFE